MKFFKYLSWLVILAMLTACASRDPSNKADEQSDWTDLHRSGADPTTHAALETVNLIELLDPKGVVETNYNERLKGRADDKPWSHLTYAVRYDLIFGQFAQLSAFNSARQHRNLVQNRLLAASERRCGRFLQYLKKDNSNTNFRFAIFSSIFSTAGALVPGLRAAQNFSGLSALSSGLRAEYNNEYYANLAISVISRGIEEKRSEIRGKLQAAQDRAYDKYDIAAAVADAVQFDTSCNIVNGLELANEAIQRFNEPGRDAINRALLKDKLTRALVSEDTGAIQKLSSSLEGLNINTQPVLTSFTDNLASLGNASRSVDYSVNATQPGAVSALAGQTLISLQRSFAQLQADAIGKINATGGLNTVSIATLTGSVTAATQSLSVAISGGFSGTRTTSCFEEAKDIATKLASAQLELSFARSKGQSLQPAEVKLEDQLVVANHFAQKLSHYEQVAYTFKRACQKFCV